MVVVSHGSPLNDSVAFTARGWKHQPSGVGNCVVINRPAWRVYRRCFGAYRRTTLRALLSKHCSGQCDLCTTGIRTIEQAPRVRTSEIETLIDLALIYLRERAQCTSEGVQPLAVQQISDG
jgi:hypothetical protein